MDRETRLYDYYRKMILSNRERRLRTDIRYILGQNGRPISRLTMKNYLKNNDPILTRADILDCIAKEFQCDKHILYCYVEKPIKEKGDE